MVYSASTQSCSFDAAFVIIADWVDPASIFDEFPDPQLSFYRDTLRFTEEETQQVVEATIQHFNMVLTSPTLSEMMQTSNFLEMQCLILYRLP